VRVLSCPLSVAGVRYLETRGQNCARCVRVGRPRCTAAAALANVAARRMTALISELSSLSDAGGWIMRRMRGIARGSGGACRSAGFGHRPHSRGGSGGADLTGLCWARAHPHHCPISSSHMRSKPHFVSAALVQNRRMLNASAALRFKFFFHTRPQGVRGSANARAGSGWGRAASRKTKADVYPA